ncbi:tyrosine-type recombinase/integrase [Pandoraea sputorum]|uniref:Tyrosine recombinase XerC n=1 Tax=Pandoraea sputorum TaxID=93222 RepID=A0A5E5BFZ6_9BURK|nr:tyrosine-type recombinase/integrase [Pandoraea sputorum]VVE85091.1 Tyrosine recombinase XerC [Pandoraea sputorum]
MATERQTRAGNEVAALKAWLAAMAAGLSPTTVQSYRQHAERLLNWQAFVRQRPLAAMTMEDCTAYRAFLAAPPAHWIAPRGTALFTSAWRPFSKPLDEPSVRLSMTVLRRMCTWLSAVQYLRFAPVGLRARPRGEACDTTHAERVLTDDAGDALEAYWRPRAIPDALAERTLFVLQRGRTTGLRLAELARATVGDRRGTVLIHGSDGRGGGMLWSLSVRGKGSTLRQIVADPALARVALIGRLPQVPSSRTPAFASAAEGGPAAKEVQETTADKGAKQRTSLHAPLTPAALRQVIAQGYRVAAQAIAQQRGDAAGTVAALSRAAPHGLRHPFGTHALEHGAALKVVQKRVGYVSIATTSKYLHPEKAGARPTWTRFLAANREGISASVCTRLTCIRWTTACRVVPVKPRAQVRCHFRFAVPIAEGIELGAFGNRHSLSQRPSCGDVAHAMARQMLVRGRHWSPPPRITIHNSPC